MSVFLVYVIALVLDVLMRSLLHEQHCEKDEIALWRAEQLAVFEADLNIFTSSAYQRKLQSLNTGETSFIKIGKRSGPRTEP